jgi:nicotinate phosphoribosyltransferase
LSSLRPWVTDDNVALLTDLYELTMAASYHARGMNHPATFDLFVRKLPPQRKFLIACGISDALDYLERLHFNGSAIDYLRSLGIFGEHFLEYLTSFRFSGEVWAMAEGDAAFGEEPILRVTAPLIEAQIVETFLLNCVTFQTLIASKAARIGLACGDGASFVDFSARRDHGTDAAMRVARAAYIAGASGTSNVLAGAAYGIPLSGTMAHSYVMSFEHELDAFRAYARDFPGSTTLLIDTYDTIQGAKRAALLARELSARGGIQAVRIDSGDIADLSRGVRAILDEAGLPQVRVLASGDLDEYHIAELRAAGAPVDAFGVGTRLGTSADAPTLSSVYKLVEDARGPRMKLSPGKATLPGRKQVYRFISNGRYSHDLIALENEASPEGARPLLRQVLADGRRLQQLEPLAEARERCRLTLTQLPERLRLLQPGGEPYRVERSPGLQALVDEGWRTPG